MKVIPFHVDLLQINPFFCKASIRIYTENNASAFVQIKSKIAPQIKPSKAFEI